jgi:hypothetical protein
MEICEPNKFKIRSLESVGYHDKTNNNDIMVTPTRKKCESKCNKICVHFVDQLFLVLSGLIKSSNNKQTKYVQKKPASINMLKMRAYAIALIGVIIVNSRVSIQARVRRSYNKTTAAAQNCVDNPVDWRDSRGNNCKSYSSPTLCYNSGSSYKNSCMTANQVIQRNPIVKRPVQ